MTEKRDPLRGWGVVHCLGDYDDFVYAGVATSNGFWRPPGSAASLLAQGQQATLMAEAPHLLFMCKLALTHLQRSLDADHPDVKELCDHLNRHIIAAETPYKIPVLELQHERDMSLKEMQAHVGGYIEAVRCPDGTLMYVNEEGLIHGLPYNNVASDLAGKHIVGPAIVVREEYDEDEEDEDDAV